MHALRHSHLEKETPVGGASRAEPCGLETQRFRLVQYCTRARPQVIGVELNMFKKVKKNVTEQQEGSVGSVRDFETGL